jgi:hypothetical protein
MLSYFFPAFFPSAVYPFGENAGPHQNIFNRHRIA